MSLCRELEELGGGIKTRLERIVNIRDYTEDEGWIRECLIKFISINYNSCLIMYGCENRLFSSLQDIPLKIFKAL